MRLRVDAHRLARRLGDEAVPRDRLEVVAAHVHDADVVTRAGEVPRDRRSDRAGSDDDEPQRSPRPAGAVPRSAVRGVTPASRSSVFRTFAVGVFGSASTNST